MKFIETYKSLRKDHGRIVSVLATVAIFIVGGIRVQ